MRRPQVSREEVLSEWKGAALRGVTHSEFAERMCMSVHALRKCLERARLAGDKRAISNMPFIDHRAHGLMGVEKRWPRRTSNSL